MAIDQRFTGVCFVLLPAPGSKLDEIPDAHMTLHYLGKEDNFLEPELSAMGAMARSWATQEFSKQVGKVSGSALFLHPMSEVSVWLFDCLTLTDMRQRVHRYTDGWRRTPELHGFIPHITTPDGYGPPEEPYPVTFDRLALWAGKVRHEWPLK